MNLEGLAEELELDQQVREDELRRLKNIIAIADEVYGDNLRRALVVMIYAHLEGAVKFSFSAYVRYINEMDLRCGDVTPAIVAASLSDVFRSLRDPLRRSSFFVRELPDDAKLHSFARDQEFVEKIDALAAKNVQIPETAFDVEDNLKPSVLRKLLFRVGLKHDAFDTVAGEINKLLNYRNRIAHGEVAVTVSDQLIAELLDTVTRVMNEVRVEWRLLSANPLI